MPDLVSFRAELHPDRVAAIFFDDGERQRLTYGELWRKALQVADAVRARIGEPASPEPGDAPRVMMIYPPGLEFLPAFIGCQLAGAIPVPTCYPRAGRPMPRVDSVARNCAPTAIVSTGDAIAGFDLARFDSNASLLPMIATDRLSDLYDDHGSGLPQKRVHADAIALLQYTSGSTSEPKGVIVRQRNIMANLRAIADGFSAEVNLSESSQTDTAISWLPFFHDMGLIGGMLAPIYSGFRCVFMSPQSFVQRPIRWLQLISEYRATISGGPNFAYELCADRVAPDQAASLDLSSWRVAYCGAEPLRARTFQTFAQRFSAVGFRETSFLPCYGLAEATLLATGSDGPQKPLTIDVDRTALRSARVHTIHHETRGQKSNGRAPVQTLVSSGVVTQHCDVRIVDFETSRELPQGSIGEIWLAGPSISDGYWNNSDENSRRFSTLAPGDESLQKTSWLRRLVGSNHRESVHPGGAKSTDLFTRYLRTGDLGFILNGQLFVTGRVKDVIIIRGRNYAPQDIELSVLSSGGTGGADAYLQGNVAAFAIEGPRAEALAVVAEINRSIAPDRHAAIVRDIRRIIIQDHEIDPRLVLLVRPGMIPLTTSGKIQRSECNRRWQSGELDTRHRWERSGGTESPPMPLPDLTVSNSPSGFADLESRIQAWLTEWLVSRAGIDPTVIQPHRRLDEYGLDSLTAVELSGEIEDWSGIDMTPAQASDHPSIAAMAGWITSSLIAGLTPMHTATEDSSIFEPSRT